MYKKLILIIFVVFVISCSKPEIISKTSLGKIIDVSVIPTSFNESVKIQIKTEKLFLVIPQIISVPIGEDAYKITYSDGKSYVTWESAEYEYRI